MKIPRITDKDRIQQMLDDYMLRPQQQYAPFLVEIFTRQHHPGGMIYEGARPLSAVTDYTTGEKHYTLTNSDSNYTQPIATINLSQIEYISTL